MRSFELGTTSFSFSRDAKYLNTHRVTEPVPPLARGFDRAGIEPGPLCVKPIGSITGRGIQSLHTRIVLIPVTERPRLQRRGFSLLINTSVLIA